MMDRPILRSYLEQNEERIISELRRFIAQPSVSTQGIGMEECANLLLHFMEEAGIEARLIPIAGGYPMVYGEVTPLGAARTMLVYGHYDVQPPDPLGEWDSDPYEGQIRGGRLYGRGAADDKGQLFTQIKAVEAVMKTAGECPINLKFLFEGEEEIGSPHLVSFVESHRNLLTADVFFRSDGSKHESGRPVIQLGQKGMLYVELAVTSGSLDLHSMRSGVVVNPTWHLLNALSSIYDARTGRVSIGGFYDSVHVTESDREMVSVIPFDRARIETNMGTRIRPGLVDGRSYYEAFLLMPHLTISGISAGYVGPGVKTIVPRRASAKIDIRLVPHQDPLKVEQLLRVHLDSAGFGDVEIRRLAQIRPSRTPPNHPYVDRLKETVQSVYQSEPVVYPSCEGSGPAYVFTELLSLPAVLVPCAQFDCRMHAPNENIELSGMLKGIELFAELMFREAQA